MPVGQYTHGSVFAIDPGDTDSAWVLYDLGEIVAFGYESNERLLYRLRNWNHTGQHLAIEMIASYGMAVGRTVFDTCVMIGRCIEAWGHAYTQVFRIDVKMCLCKQPRAKDANVRQALIDIFGPPGTKKRPGRTYGISGDVWAALGVAYTWTWTQLQKQKRGDQ